MLRVDGLDKALIGVRVSTTTPVLVYDYDKSVSLYMKQLDLSYEDALEHLEFNTIGANFGEKSPVFIRKHKNLQDVADWDYLEDEEENIV
tara:strand:- start:428 stop:697 length:270 start_codon:yes stop_codon:yes gene_type:complete